MKPRVVLVDDHALLRAGVRGELGARVDIVGEAGSLADAIPLIKATDPDVVLLDVHLPDGGGEGVIAAVAPERPGVKFLALSVSDAAEDVIAVIRAGARGYVTKTISADELADAVLRVAEGDAVFSPASPASSLTHSVPANVRIPTPISTSSPPASEKSSNSSLAGTATRKSPLGCTSPSRPSRATSPTSFASSS